MPLYEKLRIELFLPDLSDPSYEELEEALENEFTYSFGGCSLIPEIRGFYLSSRGEVVEDRVNLLFTDSSIPADKKAIVEKYVSWLDLVVSRALQEESILIAVHAVLHG